MEIVDKPKQATTATVGCCRSAQHWNPLIGMPFVHRRRVFTPSSLLSGLIRPQKSAAMEIMALLCPSSTHARTARVEWHWLQDEAAHAHTRTLFQPFWGQSSSEWKGLRRSIFCQVSPERFEKERTNHSSYIFNVSSSSILQVSSLKMTPRF